MKHGLTNKSVALIEYVSTPQSVAVNLPQPGLNYPASKLHQSINDVLKDKKYYLEKGIGKIQLKKSNKYFHQNSRTNFFVPN